ncbi:nitroreductase family deazaflavin-dependent oxidoreductase [Agromyces protaetiae]|uniref:Nitroreductase family deazaflavin-dependent oxidoreductase n=1 Tax=Agromyces protaetiae TaxID=2509455 RepID=A0A4P6FDP1_9MICO|nr:nitroreductase family deazaflavin-dependent oxidoreductase [Agromyces protaetiae]QAY73113.1 nitroreductase family deazaflavin-dependent oxidoreductase [Agromyces protaetiae]
MSENSPSVPPRWFVRTAWVVHRILNRLFGGRVLRKPVEGKWGMLVLRTTGRKSGETRQAILAYFDDGPDLVLMAMNGWANPEPAWWLNLQAHPEASVTLPDGTTRDVRARTSEGAEHDRLWRRWNTFNDADLDGYETIRGRQTAVVVLEPR